MVFSDVTAQNYLGNCYQNGIGTEINESDAFKWYSKSANRECALGQCNLGYCYENGIGTEKNEKKAYLKSSKKGNAVAQNNCFDGI